MKILILGAFLTFLQQVKTACDVGCLQCSTSGDCLICDLKNNYYLSNGNCTKSNLTSCNALNMDGTCSACKTGTYFESGNQNCTTLDSASLIKKCIVQKSSSECSVCESGFFPDSGSCAQVDTPIKNCNYYVSSTLCGICKTGFTVSEDQTECIANTVSNCRAVSKHSCTKCSSGYFLNKNLYLSSSYKVNPSTDDYLQFYNGYSIASKNLVCEFVTIPNCAEFLNNTACKTCNKGFFVNSTSLCQENPVPVIPNCATYSDNKTCSSCKNKFRFDENKNCIAVTPVDNCVIYDGSASSDICLECSATYYLSGGVCILRDLSKTGCKSVSISQDICTACSGTNVLTESNICVKPITNCLTYDSSSTPTLSVCSSCFDKYFLNQTNPDKFFCQLGTVSNCLRYDNNGVCTSCSNGFYLNTTTANPSCSRHLTIAGCGTYHSSNPNECATCNRTFVLLKKVAYCDTVKPITNCVTYSVDGLSCVTCKDGFAPNITNNSQTCIAIPNLAPLNCAKWNISGWNCDDCLPGFYLNSTKFCLSGPSYQSTNCSQNGTYSDSATFNSMNNCAVCAEKTIPFSISNSYVCLKNNLLVAYGVSTNITNCIRYNGAKCAECSTGFVLDGSGATACVANCPATFMPVVDNLDGRVNLCVAEISGCALASRVAITSGNPVADYACIKLKDITVSYFQTSFIQSTVTNPYNLLTAIGSNGNQELVSYNSYAYSVVAWSSNTGIAKCIAYATVNSKVTCQKCEWGNAPTIASQLAASCDSIANCDTTTAYSTTSSVFNAIFSCHKCSTGGTPYAYVNVTAEKVIHNIVASNPGSSSTSQTCSSVTGPNAITNCAAYVEVSGSSPLVVACAACLPGYTPSYDTTYTFKVNTCNAISNCDSTSTMLNGCNLCASGYLPASSDYQSCVLSSIPNCLIASVSTCLFCQSGYFLNKDNICEEYRGIDCQASKFSYLNLNNVPSITSIKNYYLLAATLRPIGCNSCNAGSTAVLPATNIVQCMSTKTIDTNPTNSLSFIKNCKNLVANPSSLICSACMPNFLPSNDNTTCGATIQNCLVLDVSNLSNCKTCNSNTILINGKCGSPIPNCLTYNNGPTDPQASCSGCRGGNKLVSNKCNPALVTNCETYTSADSTKCQTCKKGFGLKVNACVSNLVPNCQTYGDSGTDTQKCVLCNSGFALMSNGTCIRGIVPGCDVYAPNDITTCSSCLPNNVKIVVANNVPYCLPIDPSLNCQTLDTTDKGTLGGFAKCNQCATIAGKILGLVTIDQTIVPSIVSLSVCSKIQAIANCESYDDQNSPISSNSFLCNQCSPGFYYNSTLNRCDPRKNKPVDCLVFDRNSDTCASCKNTTYLADDKKNCITNPSGIFNCEIYSDNKTCTQCNSEFFLSSGTCVAVNVTIENCDKYNGKDLCERCKQNFFLASTKKECISISAQNCFIAKSPTACSSCDPSTPKFLLRTMDDGSVNCEQVDLPNCQIPDPSFTSGKCKVCDPTYYVDASGTCNQGSIDNCDIYASQNSCKICKKGYSRSADSTNCIDVSSTVADPNCDSYEILKDPSCIKCDKQTIFSGISCAPFTDSLYRSGCMYADPRNSTSCLICMPGAYQNVSGAPCLGFALPTQAPSNSTTNSSKAPANSSSSIYAHLLFTLIMIFAMLW